MALVCPYSQQISPLQPSRDCEIFVCKIPRSICEQELRSMFEKYGDIFHVHLVRRPEKRYNYAFVRFMNIIAVKVAVLRWNGYEIRPQERISVCRSIENKKLVLFNVPKRLQSYEIMNLISLYTTGLQDVQVSEPRDRNSVNAGLAFLMYDTHTCASIAKKTLNSSKDFHRGKKPLYAEWHTPGLSWDNSEVFIGKEASLSYYPSFSTASECNLWSSYGFHNTYRYYSDYVAVRKIAEFYSGYSDGHWSQSP